MNKMLFEREPDLNERRKTARLRARTVSFALLHFREPIIGQINDISIFGASILYFRSNRGLDEELTLDIFTSDNRFVLKDIPIEIVSDFKVNVEIDLGQTALRKRGVKFLNLSKAQKEQLKHFMRLYAVGSGGR
jgi:hypothetical protein